jgi:excisionase family DNA binding protein
METLFSVKQAAKVLGDISPWTIYAWLSQGRLKKVKIGSRTMIAASELERFIADGTRKAV